MRIGRFLIWTLFLIVLHKYRFWLDKNFLIWRHLVKNQWGGIYDGYKHLNWNTVADMTETPSLPLKLIWLRCLNFYDRYFKACRSLMCVESKCETKNFVGLSHISFNGKLGVSVISMQTQYFLARIQDNEVRFKKLIKIFWNDLTPNFNWAKNWITRFS